MTSAVVQFDRVWKKFRRGERHDSLRDLLPSLARRVLGRSPLQELGDEDEFWALKDVSFEVEPGEGLGIVGPNGAGKSTVLKLLTRILRPTRGKFHVRGKVGALIEVAAGFHPDLTGRENVFLQGAIMGMKRRDIAAMLDDIVDFSGIGPFIDTQVKRYSSGMNARLGFSIAAQINPDVLIIDEALSVGDMEFQQRCVSRMLDFKRKGVAIVFVSHDLNAVAKLCDRALLLNKAVVATDQARKVLELYIRTLGSPENASTGEVSITRIVLLDESGRAAATVRPGDILRARVTYQANVLLDDFQLGFLVRRSADGLIAYDEPIPQQVIGLPPLTKDSPVTVEFEFAANLTRGHYYVELHVYHVPTQRHCTRVFAAAVFDVEESRTYAGVANLDVRPKVIAGGNGLSGEAVQMAAPQIEE